MAAFTCVVCFDDQKTKRLALPKLTTLNGNILRASDCNHPVCQECMAAFVAARVDERMVFGIRCPFEGCQNVVYEQDVQKLVEVEALAPDIAKQFAELRKQDYTSRFADLTNEVREHTAEDLGLMKILWASTRRCPRCNVIIQKSEGCNSFGCTCGHRFNFATAPRGCGDGILRFDQVVDLVSDFGMPLGTAMRRMQEASAKGIKNYKRVMTFSRLRQISLSLAELHEQALLGQGHAIATLREARCRRRHDRKAQFLMVQLFISLDDAMALLEQARAGDEGSWVRIKQARAFRKDEAHADICVAVQQHEEGADKNSTIAKTCPDSTFHQASLELSLGGA